MNVSQNCEKVRFHIFKYKLIMLDFQTGSFDLIMASGFSTVKFTRGWGKFSSKQVSCQVLVDIQKGIDSFSGMQ